MADVPSSLNSWSATASSNSPTDATNIGGGLADNLQALQAVVRGDLATKGTDIASSAAPDVGAVQGLYHDITGSNTITGLGSSATAGIWKILQFDASPPLIHSTALQLVGGATIVPDAGDVGIFFCEASNQWRMVSYSRADIGPQSTATSSVAGIVELATDAETLTGTDTQRAVTPSNLNSVLGLALLNSGTVSNAATLDIDLTGFTAYNHFRFVFSFLPATDGVVFDGLVSIDGGSTFEASNYKYGVVSWYDDGSTTAVREASNSATGIGFTDTDIGNAATEGVSGTIDIFDPASTTLHKKFLGHCAYLSSGATTRIVTASSACAFAGTDDVTDLRFLFSSGNIASGTWSLYGWSK